MAPWRIRTLKRTLLAAGFAATLALTSLAGGALAADNRFDITGTVNEVRGNNLIVVTTSDVNGRPQPILIDVSRLPDLEIRPETPIQLTIVSREDDSYLALGIVRESPYVNGADFGVREEFTTRQDSIQAGVGNVPADDEALSQQHRSHNLHQRNNKEEDDNKDNRADKK